MALLRGQILNDSMTRSRFIGAGNPVASASRWDMPGRRNNRIMQWGSTTWASGKSAVPDGHLHPSALLMPISSGSLSSHNDARPTLTPSASIAGGLPASGTATMTLTVEDADGQLIANLSSAITLALTVGSASLGGAVYMSGAATMALTTATATLGALAGVSTSTAAVLTTTATLTAIGYMSSGVEDTGLTADAIAQAVWDSVVPGSYGEGTAGALMGKLLTTAKYLGLK